MTYAEGYRFHPRLQPKRLFRDRYLGIIVFILVVVLISSFYIYQRVWVRKLISEIARTEARNDSARQVLSGFKAEWVTASSIVNVEADIQRSQLGLMPTKPTQNLALPLVFEKENPGRYAGFIKAMEKLKDNLPMVQTNQAEAQQLFEAK